MSDPNTAVAAAERRISEAKSQLFTLAPWFGLLSFRLTPKAGRVSTMGTDGTYLYFSPAWVAKQDDGVLRTVVAHEVGHCAFGHPWRQGEREHGKWNASCDHAVNLLLQAEGFRLWKGALADPQYAGLDSETVYARLPVPAPPPEPEPQPEPEQGDDQDEGDDDQEQAPGEDDQEGEGEGEEGEAGDEDQDDQEDGEEGDPDAEGDPTDDGDEEEGEDDGQPGEGQGEEDGEGGDDGQPGEVLAPTPGDDQGEPGQGPTDDLSGDDDAQTAEPLSEFDWQIAVEQATAQLLKAGKLGADAARLVREAREPRTDCWEVLKRFLEQQLPTDTSWTTPNRRFVAEGLYLPGPRRENLPGIRFWVDTSASMTQRLLDLCGSHVSAIAREYRPAYVEVVYADTDVRNVQVFSPDDAIEFRAGGGGGTLFGPALAWEPGDGDPDWEGQDEYRQPPCCGVYLTDLENGDYEPLPEPDFPVLFATGERVTAPAPFGDVVRLSEWS